MKLLHTSDWHLGQNFMGFSRQEEHQAFLDWLLQTIEQEKIELLIVAGDIFDTTTPPNYALELYFNFLTNVAQTFCKKVVIIAGNHDSVAVLQSSKELLKQLNIEVIVTGDETEEEIVPLYDENQELKAIVCGVPFLRDYVVRKSQSAQSLSQKEQALTLGIQQHYTELYAKALQLKKEKSIPIIATGHLTTVGAKTSDSERDIYIGGTLNLNSNFLAQMFDYTALGHLHMNQQVGEVNVYYSGSPIPLSFGESLNKKVNIVTFTQRECEVQKVDIPLYRELIVLKGNKEQILEKLETIKEHKTWIEVHLKDSNIFEANRIIRQKVEELNLTLLALKIDTKNSHLEKDDFNVVSLDELTPLEVFQKRLEKDNLDDKTFKEELVKSFVQILDEVQ